MANQKVLIVEDDLAFVTLIQLALKDLSFDFEVARDGGQALELLRQNDYGLVITDYRLPNVDGLEVVRAAHKKNPGCQIVLISAASNGALKASVKDIPLLGLIEKPFSPIQLRDLITGVL